MGIEKTLLAFAGVAREFDVASQHRNIMKWLIFSLIGNFKHKMTLVSAVFTLETGTPL